jgi:hypothetical protein
MANGTNFPTGISVANRDRTLSSQVNRVLKTKMIRIAFGDGTTETDTGFDLPSNGFVRDVWINVVTAEATGGTKTIDIGLLASESGGDADGFADALSVAATGLVRAGVTTTTGLNETYYSANTRGVMLSDFLVGTDAASDFGLYTEHPHIMGSVTARSISWTPGSADFAELVADIAIVYEEIRVDTQAT